MLLRLVIIHVDNIAVSYTFIPYAPVTLYLLCRVLPGQHFQRLSFHGGSWVDLALRLTVLSHLGLYVLQMSGTCASTLLTV